MRGLLACSPGGQELAWWKGLCPKAPSAPRRRDPSTDPDPARTACMLLTWARHSPPRPPAREPPAQATWAPECGHPPQEGVTASCLCVCARAGMAPSAGPAAGLSRAPRPSTAVPRAVSSYPTAGHSSPRWVSPELHPHTGAPRPTLVSSRKQEEETLRLHTTPLAQPAGYVGSERGGGVSGQPDSVALRSKAPHTRGPDGRSRYPLGGPGTAPDHAASTW